MVIVHAFNANTREAKVVQGHFGLQSMIQDNQSYTETPYLEKNNKKNTPILLLLGAYFPHSLCKLQITNE